MARPSIYTPELAREILERLAQGDSMRKVCSEEGMPDRTTLWRWGEDDPAFATAIARAREIGFDERAEKAVEEAQTATDPVKGRLSFDAERWYLSKLNPARYGERTTLAGDPKAPLVPPPDPAATLAAILEAARKRQAQIAQLAAPGD